MITPTAFNLESQLLYTIRELTIELTKIKVSKVEHLAIENFSTELFGSLLEIIKPYLFRNKVIIMEVIEMGDSHGKID
jgi:hypothetical protein